MAKQLQNVAALACMTILLTLFNLAFWGSGIVILCLGLWMRLELQDYVDMSHENSGTILLAVAGLGAAVALAATFACCCTLRQHPALLYLYGGFLAVVTLLEIFIGGSVYAYRSVLISSYDRGINESMQAYGTDHTKSTHIDFVQSTLHCCGKNSYIDWSKLNPTKPVPESCCKVEKGECDISDILDIHTEGCYNRVIDFVYKNVILVMGIAAGVALFPVIGLLLSCCLASYINKVNYEQIA